MTASIDLASLRERVRDALTMVRVAEHDGLDLKMEGEHRGRCCCPFHVEKSPSFLCGGRFPDRCHCFGCGADYDIFEYWQIRRNVDHLQAVKELAGLAQIYVGEIRFEKPKAGAARQPERRLDDVDACAKKPSLPRLMKPSRAACEMIAKGRGLDTEAVWLAARLFQRVAYAHWPQFERGGEWEPRATGAHPSWCAIDETRNVAEFRRLDNGLYTKSDGDTLKVWSTAGKSWPLGARQVPQTRRVLMVEGGPDMLAGYHFLRMWATPRRPLLQDVTVVAMLGASNKIREDALPFFKGARVRMFVDADTPKDSPEKAKRRLVGLEAAARWTRQLSEAGSAVECFYVGDVFEPDDVARWHEGEIGAADIRVVQPGFVRKDGAKVKDLNDVALCGDDVTGGDDMREAMTLWDF